ncbi:iron-sulfur cluster repair di-iron protein [Tichowtungia aerotolerans]|uniref:Iron-sulfur cluster repair di-iron protein n=1 Tax=Tichowtungia aerotolerans TaxID=2697043 RepID=A0A6P1M2G0_9BACT|nr:iron-sulfur cluster repair di-iron protein [Tichowtungia aerotolerans]QHI68017.1 iron-sulfur cluster repair di-iron protein [Tichowtungia aerotolerans]
MKMISYSKTVWVASIGLLVLSVSTACVRNDASNNPLKTDNEGRAGLMKHGIESNITVANLVVRYPQLRASLELMGIDYCCGGKKPLGIAVKEAGLQWEAVQEALMEALAVQPESVKKNWADVPLSELVDHIVLTHHVFMKEQLPRLSGLLVKVEKAHGAQHGEMLAQLRLNYSTLRSELEAHLMKEEQDLFPLIKQIEAFSCGNGPAPVSHCRNMADPIRQMEIEHDHAGNTLATLRRLTDNYQLPSDACPTFEALYEGLAAMEADLHEHIHLENNILFPKSAEQAATVNY